MSKESRERGLGLRHHGALEEKRAKPGGPTRRERFVPDAQDYARLLPRLVEAPRR